MTTIKKLYKTTIMKKLLFAALLVVSMGSSAFAGPKKVSTIAKNNFQSEYLQASNVIWSAEEDYSKATFTLNNVRMEAYYEPNGQLIGTSKAITLDQLGVSAKRSLAKKFGSYEIKEAIRFESADDSAYFISAENEKETVVIKVGDDNSLSVFKRSEK